METQSSWLNTTVRNKNELLEQIKKSNPGDVICVKGTTYSLTISDQIHDEYLTTNGGKFKRYKTNLDKLITSIKRTPMKIWSC